MTSLPFVKNAQKQCNIFGYFSSQKYHQNGKILYDGVYNKIHIFRGG